MGMIYYGVESFKKVLGPVGPVRECSYCHKSYQETYVKFRKFGHIDFIPLLPLGVDICHFCPVCFQGGKFEKQDKKEAKQVIKAKGPVTTNLVPKVIHHSAEKTYDLILEDKNSGETFPLGSAMKKSEAKSLCKNRFYKFKKLDTVEA